MIVHDFAIVGPITAANMSKAKGLAAERARQVLADEESPHMLSRICDCHQVAAIQEEAVQPENGDVPVEGKRLDDETEAGFAALAQKVLTEVHGVAHPEIDEGSTDEVGIDEEEDEVVLLLQTSETSTAGMDLDGQGPDSMDVDSDSGDVGHLTGLSSSMEI